MTGWGWPEVSFRGGVDGSAMSKLFRGGDLTDTALLAREAIQNSSDAHTRYLDSHPGLSLRIKFRFVNLYGNEKQAAIKALDLGTLQKHREKYNEDPLQAGNALDTLDDPRVPLSLMYVEDYGSHGLYGDPRLRTQSHLFKAMYSIGTSTKGTEEGGSYGFGKSALQRASRTHSVIVHSTFEQHNEDSTTSRLIGFTWWPDLLDHKQELEGRGGFTDHTARDARDRPVPFEGEDATLLARELGFQPRRSARPEEHGTSFLVIDPAISPENLLSEIERWWWPALEEHQLDIEIILASGEVMVPKPASNPFVSQFLRPYRLATGVDVPTDPDTERIPSKDWRIRSGVGGRGLGDLALTVPEDPVNEDGEEAEAEPLVALMRSPRMVVEYSAHGKRRVPLRGVFIASPAINSLLRATEPATHDQWSPNESADVPQEASDTARAVRSRVHRSVVAMAKEVAPAPPKTRQALSHFSRLMSGFIGTSHGKQHTQPARGEPIELTFPDGRPGPQRLNENEVQIQTRFAVRVADSAEGFACSVLVACRLSVFEDDLPSSVRWPVSIRPVTRGHTLTLEEDGTWTGILTKEQKIVFEAESEPYPNLWTVSFQPSVSRTSDWSHQ